MAKETENLKLSLYDPIEDKDVKVKDVINNVLGYTNSNTTKIDAKFKDVDDNVQILHDYILDAEGNIIFYSKAVVNKLLTKKLDLTGGTMSGKILINAMGSDAIKICGSDDSFDEEITFERTDTGAAISCGIGASGENMGLYDRTNRKWAFHTKATTGEVFIDGKKCLGFVVASGSNYVRFGDGTQICWGEPSNGSKPSGLVTYPMPFASSSLVSVQVTRNYGGVDAEATKEWMWIYDVTSTKFTVASHDTIHGYYIAVGRWK